MAFKPERLFELRKSTGTKLKDIKEGLQIPLSSVYYWENGQQVPSADMLENLANFYKVPITHFFD